MSGIPGIVLAADELNLGQCVDLVKKIGAKVYAVKIHNLFDMHGPQVVDVIHKAGASRVWVDLKLHDIPNTVALRAAVLAAAGADIISVHASGEIEMMKAAIAAFRREVYAITVLTSLSEEQAHLLYGQPSKGAVLYLARLAALAGATGVVCSPNEVGVLSKRPELKDLRFVVPGVRSAGKDINDQKRVGTPTAAVKDNATIIVCGRQLTNAEDPVAALEELEEEVTAAFHEKLAAAAAKPK